MTSKTRWLPSVGVAVTAALFGAANVMAFGGSFSGSSEDLFLVALTTALLTLPVVGAVLVRRHQENAIGWLFSAAGPLFGVMLFSQTYVENYILAEGATGGFADFMLWVGVWTGPIAYSLITAWLLLLFPTGHLLSRRWRPVAFLTAGSVMLLVVGSMLARELDDYEQLVNPYALGGSPESLLDAARGVGWMLLSISVLFAGISLMARFRRSRGVERQQIKWMVFAASLLLVSQVSWFVAEGIAPTLVGLSFAAIPIAVGVAILRYRLYDIDLIINRTLVYGVLSAVLGLLYIGLVVVMQQVTGPITPESDLAVASSTLAVAALFRPARGRVQNVIDKRFYRHKYDAAKTLESFSTRLRDEIDLQTLTHELGAVLRRTMEPGHVSLWLQRPPATKTSGAG